jgi:hypothetical protein
MRYFGVTLNVSIASRVGLFQSDLACGLGLHLRVSKPSRWVILKRPCMWVLYLELIFHLNLQYLHLYLPLRTKILGLHCKTCAYTYLYQLENLGLHCNTYTCTYLYQLEFWGFVAIPTFVLTSTNYNFGASLQYLHLYLPLPIKILGPNCNTYICIYFYQLGFWGLVIIPTCNINIITVLVFLHFKFFVFITWKQ